MRLSATFNKVKIKGIAKILALKYRFDLSKSNQPVAARRNEEHGVYAP